MEEHNEEVEAGIREYWYLFLRRFWTVSFVFVLVLTGFALYAYRQPKIYEAQTSIIVEYEAQRVQAIDSESAATPWYYPDLFFETQIRFIKSRKIAERVVRNEGLAENLVFLGISENQSPEDLLKALQNADPVGRLIGSIDVEPLPDTRVVVIKVQHQDPEMAAQLANAVAYAYKELSSEHRMQSMQDAFHWLENQYSKYEDSLKTSGEELTRFKEENPLLFTSPAAQQEIVNAKIDLLNAQLAAMEDERRRVGQNLKEIKKVDEDLDGVGVITILAGRESLEALVSEYRRLELEVDEAKLKFHPNSEEVKNLKAQSNRVHDAIVSEIRRIKKGYKAKYNALKRAETEQRAELEEVKKTALKLDQLKLLYEQVESKKEEQQRLYELVQRRLNEINLTRLLESDNIQIMDEATVPVVPVKPRFLLIIGVGVVVGLLLGLGAAYLQEVLDTTVRSQNDIEKEIGLPFLGVIPSIAGEKRKVTKKVLAEGYKPYLHINFFPRSSIAECARTIRTNILFMSPKDDFKVLLVTSPSPLEGKTTTAINIATVMAQSSRRVLILEADMRRPRLHKAFGEEPVAGISDVLLDGTDVMDVLRETGVEGLQYIPCGRIPENPSELLHTKRFKETLQRLSEVFDRIIIDSPPVIAVADALVLAQYVEGVVVVTREGKTRKPLLKRTRELLEGINAPIVGTVLNNVNLGQRRYGTYYYYYYQGYGQYRDEGGA